LICLYLYPINFNNTVSLHFKFHYYSLTFSQWLNKDEAFLLQVFSELPLQGFIGFKEML